MACIEIEVDDYLDDASTDALERELRRRQIPFSSYKLADIRRELLHAWRTKDEIGFRIALRDLEEPETSRRRLNRIEGNYRRYLTSRAK